MRTCILIMLVALALGQAASAAYPVVVNITSDHVWMVADNKDSATITVTVTNGTGVYAGWPLPGANVSFTVNSPWQMKDSLLLTDNNGNATTTLLSTTVSGTANITVTVSAMIYDDIHGYQNYSVSQTINQPIDHTTPSSIVLYYNGQVQVRTPTPISVLVLDKFGNPVDNRHVVENVQFVASPAGLSGFQSGTSWVKSITVPVNASGYANVQYRADPPGINYVSIIPPSPIAPRLISIQGLSQGNPFSVTSVVSPGGNPPYMTINTGAFTIGYTFYDQNGYPTQNQPVNITTNIAGESMSLTTNSNGMVVITYGPKSVVGNYTINATAANNISVSSSRMVQFVSGAPTNALLTASPQTMASRDVTDSITSTLDMKVIDQKGNPVAGQLVNFRFTSFSVGAGFNQTVLPVLENGVTSTSAVNVNVSATSDANGDAMVTFHPGAFTTNITDPKYSPSASGSAVVQALWSTVTQQVTLRYMNYPYLTVQSWVDPTTLTVNQSVNVTVRVSGDGWALQPKPVKVMLVIDRSGSMLFDTPDREWSVMQAAKQFVNNLSPTRDSVGLVTFGGRGYISKPGNSSQTTSYMDNTYIYPRTYSDYATVDAGLGTPFSTVLSAIDQIVPDGGTPTRYALKVAIGELANHTSATDPSVKAIILLSDGDYCWFGDPMARGVGKTIAQVNETNYNYLDRNYTTFSNPPVLDQNMSAYAKRFNITIYTIGFASQITPEDASNLSLIANGTVGGMYFPASGANIASIYNQIAGTLKTTAGVNTTMSLSFRNINVTINNVTSTKPGNQVFNYTYINGQSTLVDYGNSSLGSYASYPKSFDNSSDWKTSQGFTFNLGTIKLGDYWQSTVTLQVLQAGTIGVFDPTNSNVTTQDPTTSLKTPLVIPGAYVVALPNTSAPTILGAAQLHITNLTLTNPGSSTSADLLWNLTYNGMYPISEDIMMAPYGTTMWNHLPLQQVSNTTTFDTASISLSGYPTGYYTIQVAVNAYDSNSDSESLNILLSDTGISVLPPGFIPPAGTPGPTLTQRPVIKIS